MERKHSEEDSDELRTAASYLAPYLQARADCEALSPRHFVSSSRTLRRSLVSRAAQRRASTRAACCLTILARSFYTLLPPLFIAASL